MAVEVVHRATAFCAGAHAVPESNLVLVGEGPAERVEGAAGMLRTPLQSTASMTDPTPPAMDPAVVARLARLDLTDDEKARLRREFDGLLRYFAQIQSVDTTGVEPMVYPVPLHNVLREDAPRPSTPREEILRNAPGAGGGEFFRVPKVLES